MSDFEEYFTDDIVFDDQTLAALDHEEQKYLTQRGTKRQKVDDGWKPRLGPLSDDSEDLPEVSLQVDGSYGVLSTTRTTTESLNKPGARTAPTIQTSQPVAPAQWPTALNASSSRLQSKPHRRLPFAPQTRPFPVHKPKSYNTLHSLATHESSAPAPVLLARRGHAPPHELQKQFEELQKQLEQVCHENAQIQAALKEVATARMAKEGEVAVLRRGIEKSAKDHAAQLAKVKTEKDEAAAKYIRIQKEAEEKLERMKTELVFKHHEQESLRRSAPSAQMIKISEERSSQTRLLSVQSTPVALRHFHLERRDIPPPVFQEPRDPKAIKTHLLPGFQNMFHAETRLRASQTRLNLDTGNRNDASRPMTSAFPPSPSALYRPWGMVNASLDTRMDSSEIEESRLPAVHNDVQMMEAEDIAAVDTQSAKVISIDDVGSDVDMCDKSEIIEPLNQKAELSKIILSHSLPSSTKLTIRAVLGAPVTEALSPELLDTYSNSCTVMLDVIANTSPLGDMEHSIDRVSGAFVTMISMLRAAHLFGTLTTLLNLLTVLIHSFPRFAPSMLSQRHDIQTTNSYLLVSLCGIILDQREIAKTRSCDDLITEILTLLEALCFDADDMTVDLLTYIPRHRQIWIHLIHNSRSPSILTIVIRFLVVLASHRKLCPVLLSMHTEAGDIIPDKPPESTKIPLIERLCMLLVDPNRKDVESRELKMSILTFFALLSTSQPDVHAHLITSTTIIPSIILFLSQLTTVFWEDEEDIPTTSSEQTALAMRSLNQTLFFLHYLVFTSTSFLNLRQKIYVPQHRIFSGLMHYFIVTFGRLSYGEAPEWMSEQQRCELLCLTGDVNHNFLIFAHENNIFKDMWTEMARDILDTVVDGPEADRTWQTYQTEADTTSETDEEEMEKKLLGDPT